MLIIETVKSIINEIVSNVIVSLNIIILLIIGVLKTLIDYIQINVLSIIGFSTYSKAYQWAFEHRSQ